MKYLTLPYGEHVLDECGHADGPDPRIVLFVSRDPYWDRVRFWPGSVQLVPWVIMDVVVTTIPDPRGYPLVLGLLKENGPIAPLLDYLMEISDHPKLPELCQRIMGDAG